ncbi:aminotransferase class I/II-fold pyridoxal phosphate-dependent enzyme [Micromonospora sp. NPDC047134]|uniref:trans-sulfuration enzyme family protein n=1 Tax=Micromonospora sp. NPDC047134 TaxID=3154340 RepID=UPI0033CD2DDA
MREHNGTAIGSLPSPRADARWMNDLERERTEGPRLPQQAERDTQAGNSTNAVHGGTYCDPTTGAVGTPIFQTSTFLLHDTSYRAFFEGVTRDVAIYTRYGNPSQWSVQEKIAVLEGAQSALVTSSGMAAISTTVIALTNPGGHIITGYDVYGGTYNLMREDMHALGREVSFIDTTDLAAVAAAIRPETQMLLVEGLTNPLLKAPPLPQLAKLAAEHNILLVVDNTFLTPTCLRPLEVGAHVVVHSATKYLNGHSDLTAGVVAGSRKFVDRIWAQGLRLGGTLEPFSCFLLERGLKTLAVRMRAHNENAAGIAAALARHPRVTAVHHPSLPDYPYPHVREYASGFGGMVSFEVAGGDAAALATMQALRIPRVATSLGGVESLVSMPFNTSHSSLTRAQRAAAGIGEGLIRYSAGIEDLPDLINDLYAALEQGAACATD